MARGRKRIIFIGAPEHGKSTQLRKLIDSRNEGVIVHNQGQQKAYSDLPVISFEKMKLMKSGKYQVQEPDALEFYQIAYNNFRNGFVVGEDASEYMPPQKIQSIYKLVIGLRHKGIDLALIFHSIAETPPYIIRQANEIILFKTSDNWENVKDRFPEHQQDYCKKIFDQVNKSDFKYTFKRMILQKTGTL